MVQSLNKKISWKQLRKNYENFNTGILAYVRIFSYICNIINSIKMKQVQETRENLVSVKQDLIQKIQNILNDLKGTVFTEEDELAILFPFDDFAYQYIDMVPLTRIDENGILYGDFGTDVLPISNQEAESKEEDIPLDYLYIEFLYDLYVKIANYKEGRHVSEIEGVEID